MPIEFHCPHCFSQIITPDETAGKKGRCSQCGAVVPIPEKVQNSEGPVAAIPVGPVQPATPATNDPFKPTGQKSSSTAKNSTGNVTLDKQLGVDQFEPPATTGNWGEDPSMSLKMRKMVAAERAKNRLAGPGHSMVVIAAINLILVAIGVISLMIYVYSQSENEVELDSFWITFWIITLAVVMMVSMMMMIGGNHIRFARSYSMAFTGTIFSFLPLNPLCFVSIPIGFWALSTLNDPDVAEGFKRRQ